jgi:hypothetical protein
MSKLNMKVIDMENPVLETAKKVSLIHLMDLSCSRSTKHSRTIVRRDSLPIKSRRTSIKYMVIAIS